MTAATVNTQTKRTRRGTNPTGVKNGQLRGGLRMEFARWLIDPNRRGMQKDWARTHGVAEATLTDWKRTPEVQAVLGNWRESFKPDFAEVVHAMFKKAKRGDVQAAKLVGEWLGLSKDAGSAGMEKFWEVLGGLVKNQKEEEKK